MNSTIEQELALQEHSFFQTVGDSMEPLLHNRESTVVLKKAEEPLKKYDVALYRRPTGEYVLHRVVKVRKETYLIQGDNRLGRETVPKEWIIGVMAGYYEGEENIYVSCNSKKYRNYLRTLKLRRWLQSGKKLPIQVMRRVQKLCRNVLGLFNR